MSAAADDGPTIELLTITVDPDRLDAFLVRDAEVWTAFLRTCDGFGGKEVWVDPDQPGTVLMAIRWATRAQWKAISDGTVAEVDARMGSLLPDTLTCRELRVASDPTR